jgi:BON domain
VTRPIVLSIVLAAGAIGHAAHAADDDYYQDPPPVAATRGIAHCPPPQVRRLTPDQARREAHQRVERGTSCWLAGTCEPGGDYKDDDKVNARVAAALAADARLVTSSLWVETLRKFVTVKGCLADRQQGPVAEALARAVPGVKLVWMEAKPVRPVR